MIDWNARISGYLNLGANAQAGLGKLLADLGAAVAAAVEASIASPIDVGNYKEAYNGNDKPVLWLRHAPVVAVAAVSRNGTALTVEAAGAVPVYPPPQVVVPGGDPHARGYIELTDGSVFIAGRRNIIVEYSAGWNGDPGLVAAVAKWAAAIFRDRERLGISSQSVAGQTSTFTRDMPEDVKQLLGAYRPAVVPPL